MNDHYSRPPYSRIVEDGHVLIVRLVDGRRARVRVESIDLVLEAGGGTDVHVAGQVLETTMPITKWEEKVRAARRRRRAAEVLQ